MVSKTVQTMTTPQYVEKCQKDCINEELFKALRARYKAKRTKLNATPLVRKQRVFVHNLNTNRVSIVPNETENGDDS